VHTDESEIKIPTIKELGIDLLIISPFQKLWTIAKPFFFLSLYVFFASIENWYLAALSVIAILFTTCVSSSHDLVHKTLKVKKAHNNILLMLIEFIALRSGHAFKICHLNHHKKFPQWDDIEGRSALMSFRRTLLEGPIYFSKLYLWAWKHASKTDKKWLLLEALLIFTFIAFSIIVFSKVPAFFIYFVFITIGGWVYPLFTVYLPHNATGKNILFQTRAFRGKTIGFIFANHNYHLEHHLYPMVPHQNWQKLAKRLDSYLIKQGVKPITL